MQDYSVSLHILTMQECLLLAYFYTTQDSKFIRTNLSVISSRVGWLTRSYLCLDRLLSGQYVLKFWYLFLIGSLVWICTVFSLPIKWMHSALGKCVRHVCDLLTRQGMASNKNAFQCWKFINIWMLDVKLEETSTGKLM